MMFEADPRDKSSAEDEIEEPFVGYREDDEDGREGQKEDDEAVQIMAVGLEAMEER